MKILSLLLICTILFGCVSNNASGFKQPIATYNNLPDLSTFGGNDGDVVIGYVNRWSDEKIRPTELPIAVNETQEGRASNVFNLRDFYEDHPTDSAKWIGPEIELGALYYVPKRFENNSNLAVVQKLCGIERTHQLGNISIIDAKAPQTASSRNRKIILSGEVAKGLAKAVLPLPISFGISASATYVLEVEIKNVRRRFIRPELAQIVRSSVMEGPECRDIHRPPRRDNKKLFLEQFFYGEITIKQIGEAEIGIDGGVVGLEGNYQRINQDAYFLAFKWFDG